MQIGSCWFDMTKAELINHDNESQWQMPENDFKVLKLLVEHRGQVLSNEQLLDCVCPDKAVFSTLEETMNRIKRFMGKPNAKLFESIDRQGYVLHSKAKRTSRSFMDLPGNEVTGKNTFLIISQVLLLFILLYAFFEPTHRVMYVQEQNLEIKNGRLGYYSVFTDNEITQEMSPVIQHFLGQLQQCEQMDWEKMFYSLSKNEKVLNIALKRYEQQGVAIKNIKATTQESNFNFIDQYWLQSMEICS